MKIEKLFPEVLRLVEQGYSVAAALRKVGVSSGFFYKKCPPKLLSELQHTKATHLLKPVSKAPRLNEFFVLYSFSNAAIVQPFGEVTHEV